MRRLRHYEARNCGFINELPIVSMTCGSMGKKKTTVITDMALSQEVMFRQKAFELLQKNDMKFPNFPWISFEMDMRNCMEHGTVYNLATVKAWVEKKRKRFEKHKNSELQLYGYDVGRYALTYKDGLKTYDIFDVLSTYAQAYAKELYIDGKLVTSVEITSATINAYAFCDYDALTSVTIGKNVTSIGDSAFSGCSSLTSVTIGGGVTSIGNSAFSRCSGLTAVTIPDSVNSIGDGAFGACSGLTSVIIPDSVNSIGRIAFYGCSSLTSVTIGEGVTSIGEDVFGWCDNLKSVYYRGTASEWGKISINDYNYYLTSATIYYYIEKETDVPTDGGNYWHYVDGAATPWEN